jgi:DivIVA domain-containing protein
MLTPDDIQKRVFTVVRARAGYNQEEVDDFLDEVHAAYDKLYEEHVRASNAPTQLIPKVQPDLPVEIAQASRLLKVAEESARQEHEEARIRAGVIVDDAKSEANRIINAARAEQHRTIGELEERRTYMQSQIDDLAKAHADVLRKLKAALGAAEGGTT